MARHPARYSVAAVVLVALAIGLLVLGALVDGLGPVGLEVEAFLFALSGTAYAVVGGIVLRRHPEHRLGWLFVLIGVLVTSGYLAEQAAFAHYGQGRSIPGALVALWYMQWYWLPFVYAQFVGIPMLFPTGRHLSARWRVVGLGLLVLAVLFTVGGMFGQRLMLDFASLPPAGSLDNPVGFLPFDDIESPPLTGVVALPLQFGVIAGIASLVQRYRRARGEERQQMKWGAYGLAITAGAFIVFVVADVTVGWSLPLGEPLMNAVAPVAIGLAISRYRLWDVDRVISRTLAYVVVTALLAGAYAVVVVGVQGVGGGRNLPDVVVALATLGAAAVFRPLRGSVQARIDRRFNRARYDAVVVLSRFGDRLRDQVDADVLVDEVRRVVGHAMEPRSVDVWVPQLPAPR